MSGTLKKCRFKLAWKHYRVGEIIQPSGALRDWLVGNGYVEVIEEPSPVRASGVAREIKSAPAKRKPGRHRRAG